MTNLETRLEEFRQAMLAKFILRDAKHPDNSVARDTTDWSALDWQSIEAHLVSEFAEYFNLTYREQYDLARLVSRRQNAAVPQDYREAVDLANIAFLRWWHLRDLEDQSRYKQATEWCERA